MDATGDNLYQEMAAWFKEESDARKELIEKAKTLDMRLRSTQQALVAAEQNVSDLQRVREGLECKLTELERSTAAKRAAEVEKFDNKIQEALATKDALYKDLVTMQQVQGTLKESLVRFPDFCAL
jgi:chromosome segregation ATPase